MLHVVRYPFEHIDDEKTKNSRKLENSTKKTLKTQGENSKSRHLLNGWMPEKRSKRKPALIRTRIVSVEKIGDNSLFGGKNKG